MRSLLLLVACGFVLISSAAAQFTDTFSDGDFSNDPVWSGTTDRWAIDTLDGDPALRSDGVAAADTIYLATPSQVTYGTWSFTFAHRNVNLSNFNGARLFLMADTDDLAGPVHGYYVQLGTNNSDEVRLYRIDGAPGASSNRVRLGQSPTALLAGDSTMLTITVTRSDASDWTVSVDGDAVIYARDTTYTESQYFGIWVKHTEPAAQSYYLDDVSVMGKAAPADTTPPALVQAVALNAGRVEAVFSEPVEGCSPERYEISGGIGAPAAIETCPALADAYVLRLARSLLNGTNYTLTVRDVADRAGNVLGEGTASFTYVDVDTTAPALRDVVINEFYYDPPDTDLEFVELFNRSDRAFDLSRFQIADDRLQPVPISDTPVLLPPGGYAVLVRDVEVFGTAFPGINVVEPSNWPALNNNGDGVVLSAGGVVVDAVFYTPSWGGADVSLERRDPDGPSDSRFNFGASVAGGGATPGAMNSLFAPDRTPPHPLYAEQVDDAVLEVPFDEPLASSAVTPTAFALDDGRIPDLVILEDEGTLVRLRFDAAVSGGRLTVGPLRDLTGNELARAVIDVAYLARPSDLVVNEILFVPLADRFDNRPDQPEYVELLNRSDRLLTLRRHYWTGVPDEDGEADTLRFAEDFALIAPQGYAVIYAASDDTTGTSLEQAFPGIAGSGAVLLPVSSASLALRNDGDLIHLHRPDDLALDSVVYHPAWHHPGLRDATGVALERLAPDDDANDGANWTSSVDPSGGTPGRPNSVMLSPEPPPADAGLIIDPSPFSPDQDGVDDVAAIRYTLSPTIALARVRIYDSRGRLVRTLEESVLAGRTGSLLWDGLDDEGHTLRIGIYVVLFEAVDTEGGTTVAFKRPVVLARQLH